MLLCAYVPGLLTLLLLLPYRLGSVLMALPGNGNGPDDSSVLTLYSALLEVREPVTGSPQDLALDPGVCIINPLVADWLHPMEGAEKLLDDSYAMSPGMSIID